MVQSLSSSCPQQGVQIEAFNVHPVVLCRSGLSGGHLLWTPPNDGILCKAINTASLAQNLMHVHLALILMDLAMH